MASPKISIIVPIYNSEKYLKICLDSLINQTLKDIEIICVNDGSTDSSYDIIKGYLEKDERIKIINQENSGVSVARNNGIKSAAAPYIMFIDSDDYIESTACEILQKTVADSDADVVIYCCALEFNGNVSPKYALGTEKKIMNSDECFNTLYRRCFGLLSEEMYMIEQQDYLSSVCLKLYNKALIINNNLRFEDINKIGSYEDGFFNLQYFSYTKKAVYIPQVLYHYRRDNSESNTSKYKERLNGQWNVLFELIQNEIKICKLPEDFQQALDNRIALSIIGLGLNAILCDCSFSAKTKLVKIILSNNKYQAAVKKLKLNKMAIHWKTFFILCKCKCTFLLVLMLQCIEVLRKRVK